MLETLNKGQLADGRLDHADSMAAENEIPFGCAVERGTDPEKQVKKFAGNVFTGIAMYSPAGDLDNAKYIEKNPVTVLRKGIIWVEVGEDVVAGDKASVFNATANFGKNGTAETTAINGEFKTSATSGNVAKLEISMP